MESTEKINKGQIEDYISDSTNALVNGVARGASNIGLSDPASDTFTMSRQDDTHLNITGTSVGVIFPAYYDTPPFVANTALKQIPTNTNYPLQNFLSYVPTNTQKVLYMGWRDSTQDIELSDTSYVQNQNVFQMGVIFLKNVSGTISFLDSTTGRTVLPMPDISQYSNLETTAIGVSSGVVIQPNTGMTVKNTASSIIGLSVNYHGANNDERPISASTPTTFLRLNPGSVNAVSLPASTTIVQTTDYWNGSSMVALTANGNASVQRWIVTSRGLFILQSGEQQFANFQDAKDAASTVVFTDIIPKGTFAEISRLIAVKNASDLTNNSQAQFISTGRGGGGTASVSTSWGTINGNISDQIDLKATLDAKFSLSGNETASGIKTFISGVKLDGTSSNIAFIATDGISTALRTIPTIGNNGGYFAFGGSNGGASSGIAKIGFAGTSGTIFMLPSGGGGTIALASDLPISGNFLPNLSAYSGLSGISLQNATYIKAGGIVTVQVGFTATSSASLTAQQVKITLPFPYTSSSIIRYLGSGTASNTTAVLPCNVSAFDNDEVLVSFFQPTATSAAYSFSILYQYNYTE